MGAVALSVRAQDDVETGVRRWRLVEDGRVIREWATSTHRAAAHPLLSWANTAHSHNEVSLLMPLSELGGLARVAAGRKPFAKEVVSDGPGAAREALSLARRVRAMARRARTDIVVRCIWEAHSHGEATGGGPHWAVCAGLRSTWGDSFDMAAVEGDWRGLVQPLLRGEAEHARFEATLAQARMLGSSLFSVPFGSHSDKARSNSPLLRHFVTLRQKRGAAGVTSALFGARRRCLTAHTFESRVVALATGHGGRRAGVLRAVQALRRHLQWRGCGLGCRAPPCHARLLPLSGFSTRGRRNLAGNGVRATGQVLRSRPRVLRSAFASLLECEARAMSCSHPPLWDCFDPQTGAELLLNGLLLGYALPATAGALLLMLTRRTIRLEPHDESLPAQAEFAGAGLLCLARRAIGRPLNAELWADLQPRRPLPSEARLAEEWRVSDVWEEGRGQGRMAGSAGGWGHGGRGAATWRNGRQQGAQIVLVRSCLFCMDDVKRDDLAASVGVPTCQQWNDSAAGGLLASASFGVRGRP